MAYHAAHNLRSHVARTSFAVQKNVQGQVTEFHQTSNLQTFYNGFASVVAYLFVWSMLALAGYHLSKMAWQAFKVWLGVDLL